MLTPISVGEQLRAILRAAPAGKIGVVTKPGTEVNPLGLNPGASSSRLDSKETTGVNARGAVPPPQKNQVSGWDTFWMNVYKVPGTNSAADAIISTGRTVEKTRDAVIETAKDAAGGVKLGTALLVLAVGIYFLAPLFLAARRS